MKARIVNGGKSGRRGVPRARAMVLAVGARHRFRRVLWHARPGWRPRGGGAA